MLELGLVAFLALADQLHPVQGTRLLSHLRDVLQHLQSIHPDLHVGRETQFFLHSGDGSAAFCQTGTMRQKEGSEKRLGMFVCVGVASGGKVLQASVKTKHTG